MNEELVTFRLNALDLKLNAAVEDLDKRITTAIDDVKQDIRDMSEQLQDVQKWMRGTLGAALLALITILFSLLKK